MRKINLPDFENRIISLIYNGILSNDIEEEMSNYVVILSRLKYKCFIKTDNEIDNIFKQYLLNPKITKDKNTIDVLVYLFSSDSEINLYTKMLYASNCGKGSRYIELLTWQIERIVKGNTLSNPIEEYKTYLNSLGETNYILPSIFDKYGGE